MTSIVSDILVKAVTKRCASLGHELGEWDFGVERERLTRCGKCGWFAVVNTDEDEPVYGSAPFIRCKGRGTVQTW